MPTKKLKLVSPALAEKVAQPSIETQGHRDLVTGMQQISLGKTNMYDVDDKVRRHRGEYIEEVPNTTQIQDLLTKTTGKETFVDLLNQCIGNIVDRLPDIKTFISQLKVAGLITNVNAQLVASAVKGPGTRSDEGGAPIVYNHNPAILPVQSALRIKSRAGQTAISVACQYKHASDLARSLKGLGIPYDYNICNDMLTLFNGKLAAECYEVITQITGCTFITNEHGMVLETVIGTFRDSGPGNLDLGEYIISSNVDNSYGRLTVVAPRGTIEMLLDAEWVPTGKKKILLKLSKMNVPATCSNVLDLIDDLGASDKFMGRPILFFGNSTTATKRPDGSPTTHIKFTWGDNGGNLEFSGSTLSLTTQTTDAVTAQIKGGTGGKRNGNKCFLHSHPGDRNFFLINPTPREKKGNLQGIEAALNEILTFQTGKGRYSLRGYLSECLPGSCDSVDNAMYQNLTLLAENITIFTEKGVELLKSIVDDGFNCRYLYFMKAKNAEIWHLDYTHSCTQYQILYAAQIIMFDLLTEYCHGKIGSQSNVLLSKTDTPWNMKGYKPNRDQLKAMETSGCHLDAAGGQKNLISYLRSSKIYEDTKKTEAPTDYDNLILDTVEGKPTGTPGINLIYAILKAFHTSRNTDDAKLELKLLDDSNYVDINEDWIREFRSRTFPICMARSTKKKGGVVRVRASNTSISREDYPIFDGTGVAIGVAAGKPDHIILTNFVIETGLMLLISSGLKTVNDKMLSIGSIYEAVQSGINGPLDKLTQNDTSAFDAVGSSLKAIKDAGEMTNATMAEGNFPNAESITQILRSKFQNIDFQILMKYYQDSFACLIWVEVESEINKFKKFNAAMVEKIRVDSELQLLRLNEAEAELKNLNAKLKGAQLARDSALCRTITNRSDGADDPFGLINCKLYDDATVEKKIVCLIEQLCKSEKIDGRNWMQGRVSPTELKVTLAAHMVLGKVKNAKSIIDKFLDPELLKQNDLIKQLGKIFIQGGVYPDILDNKFVEDIAANVKPYLTELNKEEHERKLLTICNKIDFELMLADHKKLLFDTLGEDTDTMVSPPEIDDSTDEVTMLRAQLERNKQRDVDIAAQHNAEIAQLRAEIAQLHAAHPEPVEYEPVAMVDDQPAEEDEEDEEAVAMVDDPSAVVGEDDQPEEDEEDEEAVAMVDDPPAVVGEDDQPAEEDEEDEEAAAMVDDPPAVVGEDDQPAEEAPGQKRPFPTIYDGVADKRTKRQRGGGSRKRRKSINKRKSPKTLKKRRKRRKQVKTIKRNYKRKKKSVLKKKRPTQKFKKTHKRIRKKRSNK